MEISELKDLIIKTTDKIGQINNLIRDRNKAADRAKKYRQQGLREIETMYADRMRKIDREIDGLKVEASDNNRTIEYELFHLRSLDNKLEIIDTLMDLLDKVKAEKAERK